MKTFKFFNTPNDKIRFLKYFPLPSTIVSFYTMLGFFLIGVILHKNKQQSKKLKIIMHILTEDFNITNLLGFFLLKEGLHGYKNFHVL